MESRRQKNGVLFIVFIPLIFTLTSCLDKALNNPRTTATKEQAKNNVDKIDNNPLALITEFSNSEITEMMNQSLGLSSPAEVPITPNNSGQNSQSLSAYSSLNTSNCFNSSQNGYSMNLGCVTSQGTTPGCTMSGTILNQVSSDSNNWYIRHENTSMSCSDSSNNFSNCNLEMSFKGLGYNGMGTYCLKGSCNLGGKKLNYGNGSCYKFFGSGFRGTYRVSNNNQDLEVENFEIYDSCSKAKFKVKDSQITSNIVCEIAEANSSCQSPQDITRVANCEVTHTPDKQITVDPLDQSEELPDPPSDCTVELDLFRGNITAGPKKITGNINAIQFKQYGPKFGDWGYGGCYQDTNILKINLVQEGSIIDVNLVNHNKNHKNEFNYGIRSFSVRGFGSVLDSYGWSFDCTSRSGIKYSSMATGSVSFTHDGAVYDVVGNHSHCIFDVDKRFDGNKSGHIRCFNLVKSDADSGQALGTVSKTTGRWKCTKPN